MAYDNTNASKFNVDTQGMAFYPAVDSPIQAMLEMGYWNRAYIKVRIANKLAVPNENGAVYDYKNATHTQMNTATAQSLLDYASKIVEAFEKGEEVSYGIQCSKTDCVAIGTRKIGDRLHYFLDIYKSLDEKRHPKTTATFLFKECEPCFKDYVPDTGSFTKLDPMGYEFKIFIRVLSHSIEAMSHAIGHSATYVTKLYERLRSNSGEYNRNSGGRSNLFGGKSTTSAPPQVKEEVISSLDDEIPF